MSARELFDELKAAGLTPHPDPARPGGLIVTGPHERITPALAARIKAGKEALLKFLADLARVAEAGELIGGEQAAADQAHGDHMAEVVAAVGPMAADRGDAKGDDLKDADGSFPFGCNSPGDPDCEAATLLDNLEAAGTPARIHPDDRAMLWFARSPAEAHVADIKRLKPALLKELERRGRAAELDAKPTPFPGPGLAPGGVDDGPAERQPDGLAGDADGDTPAPAAVEAEGRFVGRWRVPPGRWEDVLVAGDWGEAWDDLRQFIKQSGERLVEATVVQEGRRP